MVLAEIEHNALLRAVSLNLFFLLWRMATVAFITFAALLDANSDTKKNANST